LKDAMKAIKLTQMVNRTREMFYVYTQWREWDQNIWYFTGGFINILSSPFKCKNLKHKIILFIHN